MSNDENIDMKSIESYNADLVSELQRTSILDPSDAADLEACMPFITNAIKTVQVFRTDTEMRVSVLDDIKHPTADSKYWQIVREVNGMSTNLFQINFEFKKKILDLKLLEYEMNRYRINVTRLANEGKSISVPEEITLQKMMVDIEKTKFELLVMQRDAHHRIREIREWHRIATELEPHLKYGVEDVNAHQRLSYAVRFCKELYSNTISGATYSPAEARNAIGLLVTSIREVYEMGLLQEFVDEIKKDPHLEEFIAKNNIVKLATGGKFQLVD